jgi:hypothetical protein
VNVDEARPFIRRMFAAHGKTPVDAIVDEYADVLVRADCETCAIKVVDAIRTEERFKTVPPAGAIRGQIRDMSLSVEHGLHVGESAREVSAGALEAFWRQKATNLIAPHAGGDRLLAAFVAAQMWWSEIPADAERIVYELREYTVWIASARVFASGKDLRALVEVAFQRARWAFEHERAEEIPRGLLNLDYAEASA